MEKRGAARPCTAPAAGPSHHRPSLECWTQVDVLLRDVLLGAAITAADQAKAGEAVASTAASRRPQTACVCARPLAVVRLGAEGADEEDDEPESDGGSGDESDDVASVNGRHPGVSHSDATRAPAGRPTSSAAARLQAVLFDNAAERRPQSSCGLGRPHAATAFKGGGGYPAGSNAVCGQVAAPLSRLSTAPCLGGASSSSSTAAPKRASAPEVLNLEDDESEYEETEDEDIEEPDLPFEQRVLLGGLRRQPVDSPPEPKSSATAAATASAAANLRQAPAASPVGLRLVNAPSLRLMSGSIRAAGAAELQGAPPQEADAKLPRKAFLGGQSIGQRPGTGGGVKPSAAKMRSHVSWANFIPMRVGSSQTGAPSSSSAAGRRPAKANVETQRTSFDAAARPAQRPTATPTPMQSQPLSPSPTTTAQMPPQQVSQVNAAAAAGAEAAARAAGVAAAARAAATVAAAKADVDTIQMGSVSALMLDTQPTASVPDAAAAAAVDIVPVKPSSDAVDCQLPRRRGPKYQVLPGGSRPMQRGAAPPVVSKAPPSSAVAAAPQFGASNPPPPREYVVLEFRSEPRVVPASRGSAGAKGKLAGGDDRGGRGFRPRSRQWAIDREILAARR